MPVQLAESRGEPDLFGHYEEQRKVVVLGAVGSGKTSLVEAGLGLPFKPGYAQTFGADLYIKKNADARSVPLKIWCCSGQERTRVLMGQFIQNAAAALIVFDMLDESTFRETRFWYNEVRRYVAISKIIRGHIDGLGRKTHVPIELKHRISPETIIWLVGAKADDIANVRIRVQDAVHKATEWNIDFIPTSVVTGKGVGALFASLQDAQLRTKTTM
ncbi:hypothetical protein CXG81DRAFT_12636 [Caulochytrium protostelioides]|uniref:P-loop containing nucleoside triphosphate hydrolase protein n=1 Tax=Caulochytrium protostelioides TaxID=1555241 RepID=A0A4P9X6W6_9FUNG|nr:hypothetical protein CXG81DRAFT_12636 [Caulochytrium protostelioides]|eukprot:RKP00922.1 hypothetical protein CXG81DRAFT_12636 [Caulochytrium protostelioides]